mgnify:CR=1 FL=1
MPQNLSQHHAQTDVSSAYSAQLDALIKATKKAGEMARTFQQQGFTRLDNKAQGDPFLTEADVALDTYLKQTLTAAFPTYGWLSEETDTDPQSLDHDFCWIVDPIDGTRGFVDGKSSFAVSVGLVHRGQPVAGGVYAPMEDVLITGAVGAGVFLNGQAVPKMMAFGTTPPEILVSNTEVAKGMWQQFTNDFQLTAKGSVAYKLALLAAGQTQGVISLKPKNLHDVCAGHALLAAMGGVLWDLNGAAVPYQVPGHTLTGLVAAPTAAGADAFFQHLRLFLSQTR